MTDTFVTRAWSCTVRLVTDDPRALRAASADLVALLDRVDAAASRFRPGSALSTANLRAGRPTPVPQLLVELVGVALDSAARTDGAVDPTVGLAMHRIGYDRDIAEVGDEPRPIESRRATRTWRDVRLHREAGLLTVPVGTALDLGATTKPYIADRAAQSLAAQYGTSVLVELGGDVAVAGDREWIIDVAEREGGAGQRVALTRGGLATSTTTIRQWRRGGQTVHHILDPRTGQPADGPWRTASVHAETALAANTASTAAIVLGGSALAWLTGRGLAARLVDRDGGLTCTAGWPVPATMAGAR
jgi:thiamine biosynthesis lipoprotein